jgi:hypothetical protein
MLQIVRKARMREREKRERGWCLGDWFQMSVASVCSKHCRVLAST